MDAGADAPLERRDPTPTDAAFAHADTTCVSPPRMDAGADAPPELLLLSLLLSLLLLLLSLLLLL